MLTFQLSHRVLVWKTSGVSCYLRGWTWFDRSLSFLKHLLKLATLYVLSVCENLQWHLGGKTGKNFDHTTVQPCDNVVVRVHGLPLHYRQDHVTQGHPIWGEWVEPHHNILHVCFKGKKWPFDSIHDSFHKKKISETKSVPLYSFYIMLVTTVIQVIVWQQERLCSFSYF